MMRVLIVEDEAVIGKALLRLLEREGLPAALAPDLATARRMLAESEGAGPELILSDLRLPDGEGVDLLADAGDIPVLIMTSYASVPSAVSAMKQGAADYIAKPLDHDELLLTIGRQLENRRLKAQNARLRRELEQVWPVRGLVGRSEAMAAVCARVHRVAPTDATVLVLGESGTGKELVARAIHEQSARREQALVTVNCASIPDTLIEAELFGAEKGAFTGADRPRQGLVEAADGGTLFLDEIGELDPAVQSRLLRVLQEGEIRRVGSHRTRKVDVRLLAATHRDLGAMVAEGRFREDLFYRLNVMTISLPPLRARGEDIPLLAEHLLDRVAQRIGRPGMTLSTEALSALSAYHWPGNVRELQNALERAAILSDELEIDVADLGLPAGESPEQSDESLDDYFRRFVRANQERMTETELARRLGISRKTLWERRQKMGLQRPRR
ncbi:MAG: sigma-54-dependent transcriptional regulator [Halothiobacillaceae bacterium]